MRKKKKHSLSKEKKLKTENFKNKTNVCEWRNILSAVDKGQNFSNETIWHYGGNV